MTGSVTQLVNLHKKENNKNKQLIYKMREREIDWEWEK